MKLTGYSSEDLIGISPVNYVHPEDIKEAVSAWRAGVISGEESVEIRYKKKDGTWIWLEIRGKKFTDLNGKPKGIIISRDITKRKKAEQNLIESEKLLSTVLENSPDTILMIDRNDIIRYVNHIPKYFMKEPTIGKNFYEILMPENQDMYKQTFKKIFELGFSKTLDIPGFAGTWCTTRFIPIYSEDRVNSIMLIITNITELKKAHEKLAQNNIEKKNSNG
jgi:PAS domain S-box-containing protein